MQRRLSNPTVQYKGSASEKRELTRLMRLGHTYEEAVSTIMQAKNTLAARSSEARPPHGTPFHKARKLDGPPAEKNIIDADNPIIAAHTALHGRLEERSSGFWLDGRPASLTDVMRATNCVRRQIGMEQVGKNAAWRV